jgi:hypothetical protein
MGLGNKFWRLLGRKAIGKNDSHSTICIKHNTAHQKGWHSTADTLVILLSEAKRPPRYVPDASPGLVLIQLSRLLIP